MQTFSDVSTAYVINSCNWIDRKLYHKPNAHKKVLQN